MAENKKYQHIKVNNKEELVKKGVEFMKQKIIDSLKTDGICILGLSGGNISFVIRE
jgi:6-phosphogluconolactonase/glucosamine-6-phosphate isomerase/deaminase